MSDGQDNRKGVTSAFATLTPFRSRLFGHWESLILINSKLFLAAEPTIRELSFLHHACWVRVPARCQAGRARGRQTGRGSLLFMSYFTGDLHDYLRGFTEQLATAMNLLWDPCEEWSCAENYRQCVEFIDKYTRRSEVYFNGRADLNVSDTRVALRTRAKLEELAALAAAKQVNADEFARAYDEAVFTAFGHNGARGESAAPSAAV